MKRLLYCLTITCFVNSLANVAYAEPLSQEDVTVLLEAGVSSKDIAEKIREKGYSGKSDSDTLAAIRKKGADVNLLLAIRKPVEDDLDRQLQDNFMKFPLISPFWKINMIELNKIAVKIDDARYDGFRFIYKKEGDKLQADLALVMSGLKGASWYITPKVGKMSGFKSFWRNEETKTIFQGLSGESLVNGEEYLLWFKFSDAISQKLYISMKVGELKRHPIRTNEFTQESISEVLGIDFEADLIKISASQKTDLIDDGSITGASLLDDFNKALEESSKEQKRGKSR